MLSKGVNLSTIGVVGVGGMGAGLCLHLAEEGYRVYLYDTSDENARKLAEDASNLKLQNEVCQCADVADLFKNVNDAVNAAVYLMSVPHGDAAEKAVDSLRPYLRPDDIIVDCENEYYENTERRQKELAAYGVKYVGCGVSGGYQSARRGPSMSPGGDPAVVANLLPFFERLAAKDSFGRPCTGVIGSGGSGHYVKMIHNGIEQGMMGVLSEAWLIMERGLRLNNVEIGSIFQEWGKNGKLHGCFLVEIGAEVMRKTNERGQHVLSVIRDKVVQDAEESEGTGTWTCKEAISHHARM